MSDENNKHDDGNTDTEDRGPIAGERLAEARRAQQITVIEIAKELHLDEYKVRALENNEFDVIGAPVFAKGHLRKYAQLVKVDESDVMADYYQLDRTAGSPPLVTKRAKPQQGISPGPWIAVIVVILIASISYWWFAVRASTTTERPVVGEVAPLQQEAGAAADAETNNEEVDESPEELPPEDPPPAAEPEPEAAMIVGSSETRLAITFLGDCWTEVSDAGGRQLFFDLGTAGRTVSLSGEAPFNLLFGDAANVSITVDGAAYEIPAADRRGRTAKLTITGS